MNKSPKTKISKRSSRTTNEPSVERHRSVLSIAYLPPHNGEYKEEVTRGTFVRLESETDNSKWLMLTRDGITDPVLVDERSYRVLEAMRLMPGDPIEYRTVEVLQIATVVRRV